MRISYEKGLEDIAKSMQEYGHELFPHALNKECDAILCTSFKTVPKAGSNGALYVFAKNKTPEQVEAILHNRRYEDLLSF